MDLGHQRAVVLVLEGSLGPDNWGPFFPFPTNGRGSKIRISLPGVWFAKTGAWRPFEGPFEKIVCNALSFERPVR